MGASHRARRAAVGPGGRVTIRVLAGRDTLTGTSPMYNGGRAPCRAARAVRVAARAAVTLDVVGEEK